MRAPPFPSPGDTAVVSMAPKPLGWLRLRCLIFRCGSTSPPVQSAPFPFLSQGVSLISVFHPKLIWQVQGGILDTAEAGR